MIDLEERLRESLATRADLAAGVHVPDPARFRTAAPTVEVGSARHRRRSALLLVAASLLVVAAVATLLTSSSDQKVDISPATTAPTVEPDVQFIADWYPDGVEAQMGQAAFTETTDDLDPYAGYRLLGADGPQVVAWSSSYPLSWSTSFADRETPESTLRGKATRERTDGEVHYLSIAIRPGLTLNLAGRVDPTVLRDLSASFSDSTAEFRPERLPSGWTEFDDPGRLLLGTQSPGALGRIGSFFAASSPQVDSTGSGQRNVSVAWVAADDPEEVLDRYGQVWGGERVEINGRAAVVGVPGGPASYDPQTLVVALDDHHVGWLSSMGLSRDDLVRIAGSLRRAEPGEWPAPPVAPPTTEFEGATLNGTSAEVLATGDVDGVHWVLATDETTDTDATTPAPLRPHQLAFLHPDGETSSVWLGGANTIMNPTVSRDARLVVVVGFAPVGVTDLGLQVLGTPLEVHTAPVAGRDVQLVMAVLPAIDNDDSMMMSPLGVQLVGTNADGTPYQNEPLSGSGMSFALGKGGG